VTFTPPNPNRPLRWVVEMAFGYNLASDPATYVWTDVSTYVRGQVTITKGKDYQPGQVVTAQPCQVAFTLDNNKGCFTPENPLSPFYPNVVIGTPVRVSVTWQNAVATYERATAFVTGWPIQPNVGTVDVVSPIVAAGRLRWLSRPGKPIQSALRRAIPTTGPLAYWPMEDGTSATSCASAVAGVAPLKVISTQDFSGNTIGDARVGFAGGGRPGGSADLPDFSNNGSMSAAVPASSATSWRVEFACKMSSFGVAPAEYTALVHIHTAGDVGFWEVLGTDRGDGGLYVDYVDTSGNFGAIVSSNVTVDDAEWHWVTFDAAKSGSNIAVTAHLDGVQVISHTYSSLAFGRITKITINPMYFYSVRSLQSFGQLAVWAPWSASLNTYTASTGYSGEAATDRVTRVCAQLGIPAVVTGTTPPAAPPQPVGPEPVDIAGAVLSAVEQVDCGFLHDGGPVGKLAYVAGAVRYNAAAAFTLDYKRGHIGDGLSGGTSDTQVANDWTVSTADGSPAERADAESVARVGEFDQSASATVVDVDQAQQLAGWKSHLGAYLGPLFPSTQVDLRRSPELAEAMTNLTLPAHIGLTNLPTPWYPPIDLDQFAEGYTEVGDAVTWQVVFNTSPFAPYQVFVLNDPVLGKLDLEQTTLHTGVSTVVAGTVESWSVDTVVGLLSTAGGDYPVDWVCDGERVTVTAVSGGSSPQTATVRRGVNGITRAHSAGAVIRLWVRPVLGL